jgi:hypothetical protein
MLIFFIIKLDVHYIYIKKYFFINIIKFMYNTYTKNFFEKINKKYILFNLILKKIFTSKNIK